MKYSILLLSITLFIWSCTDSEPSYGQQKQSSTRNSSSGDNSALGYYNLARQLSSLKLPESLSFCDEPVPLASVEIRERAEREFYTNLQIPGQLLVNLKRAKRYFPLFDSIFTKENVPSDLKYLAVAESYLHQARSPKEAVGIWQFIGETAVRWGLQVDKDVDERRHVIKSTVAACRFLKSGYNRFGSWTLAAAGYNMGMEGVNNAQKAQGKSSFYDLYLNEETSRYIFRIVILKELMQNAEVYGFSFDERTGYQLAATREVVVNESISNIAEWALSNGTNYKEVRMLNPWIIGRSLPRPRSGSWVIILPA